MTKVSYEIRTLRNAPVFSFDDVVRAKQALADAEKRIKTKLKLVKCECIETEVPL